MVNNRLCDTRFKEKREKEGGTGPGNANWVNYSRGDSFSKPEDGNKQFSLARPTTIRARPFVGPEAGSINDINKRGGLGNREINRFNFLSPGVEARHVADFDALQALDIANAGTLVQLGEKTLGQLFDVRVPDPTDTVWLAERARMAVIVTAALTASGVAAADIPARVDRELEVNKPLGRHQRTITATRSSIAESKDLNTSKKLAEIAQEVRAGRNQGIVNAGHITNELSIVLTKITNFDALSRSQLADIKTAVEGVGKIDLKASNLPTIIGPKFYNSNVGLIQLYMMSRVKGNESGVPPNPNQGLTYNTPVYNWSKNQNGLPSIKIDSAKQKVASGSHFFYILERGVGIITRAEALNLRNRSLVPVSKFSFDPTTL